MISFYSSVLQSENITQAGFFLVSQETKKEIVSSPRFYPIKHLKKRKNENLFRSVFEGRLREDFILYSLICI